MVLRKQPTRAPNIYSHYSQSHKTSASAPRHTSSRNGPMVLVVGFIILVAFILAAITYANLSQRNGGGIFGLASKSTSKTDQALTTNQCADNSQAKALVVSKSKLRMWACSFNTAVQDAPVVVGMEMYAADKTPTGNYQIEQKQQNIPLTGSDTTGSWNVHVDYWLQFLQNQYGKYGFHDADWRKSSDFGNTSPNSKTASHGCVELPTPAMKWIYDWTPIGTTVVIKA